MVKGLTTGFQPQTFRTIVENGKNIADSLSKIENMPKSQMDGLLKSLWEDLSPDRPEVASAYQKVLAKIADGVPYEIACDFLRPFAIKDAAVSQTSLGTAVMAKGWEKPIIFPKKEGFKFVGWVDNPNEVTTQGLWDAAYGSTPAARMGAVGNSNIKPEQVRGGCSLSKKELSQKYEDAVQDFCRPIFTYLKDVGAKTEDIGYAFAHSDCGVDKASRAVIEEHGLKGFATTPTRYTQYLRGTEIPPSEEFPNGAILADFPFPTVLTRGQSVEVVDYAKTYGLMIGKENPMGIFGGGTHAFIHDTGTALMGKEGSRLIPVDIMKDRFGIEIPAKVTIPTEEQDKVEVLNAAANILENINGNPHEQYRYAFREILPSTQSKQDLTHDGQRSIATILYSRLAKAGKIDK